MGLAISLSDVREVVPAVSDMWGNLLADAATSELAREAPCITIMSDYGLIAEARLIVLQAVKAFSAGKPWLQSETTGPYSATYRARIGSGLLSGSDRERLRALCGKGQTGIVPLGSFPDPVDYSSMFTVPR